MKCVLARPLILGASVSSQYAAIDPGTLLARKYGTADGITRHAKPKKPSSEILSGVSDLQLSTASVVVALDLFFWDSRSGDCGAAKQSVGLFAQRLSNTGARLAVGNIPVTGGDCGEPLSKTIADMCANLRSGCALVDLRTPSTQAAEKGGLDLRDSWITVDELSADQLHPSRVGAQVIALDLEKALDGSPISCR